MKKEEFLAMSIPYGINMVFEKSGRIIELSGLIKSDNGDIIYVCGDNLYYESTSNKFKPILHPVSDLTKTIERNGEKFVPLHKLLEMSNFNLSKMSIKQINDYKCVFNDLNIISFNDAMYLVSIHFDIFDLMSKGEAIDVNELETNPYK